MLSSARGVGSLLLAVPIVTGLALSQFPGYDARSEFFAGTYRNIVDAGSRYLLALGLFLVVAVILGTLAYGLWRSPLRDSASLLWVAVGGMAASATGFTISALTGLPVWWWARQVGEGTQTVLEAAGRSADLAGLSQTVLLTVAFGGLLIGMSALGVIAVVQRWLPRWLFWATVAVAVGAVALALAGDGPALWVGFGLLPMLWAVVFGMVLLVRGDFHVDAAPLRSAG